MLVIEDIESLRQFEGVPREECRFLRADGSYVRDAAFDRPDAFSADTYFMTNPSLSGRGRALKVNTPPNVTAAIRGA